MRQLCTPRLGALLTRTLSLPQLLQRLQEAQARPGRPARQPRGQ